MTDPDDLLARSLSPGDLPTPKASLELLALARAGDRNALEDLVARYQDRLRRIVRIQLGESFLRRDHDSMDIVQSTFRAALPRIADLYPRNHAGILNWLAMIATNQIRDAYAARTTRKRDVRREVPLAESACGRLGAGDERPDEQAMLAEVRELLDDEVTRLPEDQRRVVVLRDYVGEDWDRIAAELGREQGAARQLHQRAWIRLRRALRPRLQPRERDA
ncbi:RNA polymerase sigma factor [Engelhardtia mirabilis]|uniref:ECF RNA polymerase sigma factor SigD n=1 Tax=Engelhardtia mirabilis TaxID=2528011 RepID=A0A518BNZ9_9BACT|nr:ECF RNA polymerase sigma factor SigD [Planctomycetes bacterium Pla133]QDV03032.1 ECF RNA polymerase sigma factor SigD [Planctomycetes bacterium Pla86]